MTKKYRTNLDFFKSLTSEACYWLGFISADGCIVYNKDKYIYQLIIHIHKKDIEHIKKLQNKLSDSPIREGKDGFISYAVCSKKLVEQLIKLGISPRKSLTNEFPTNIPEMYIRDFIRGYIDGDGWLGYDKTRKVEQLRIEILGTENFLISLKDIVENNIGYFTNGKVHKIKKANVYDLNIGSKDGVEKLYNWLYYDNCVNLERKWDRCLVR